MQSQDRAPNAHHSCTTNKRRESSQLHIFAPWWQHIHICVYGTDKNFLSVQIGELRIRGIFRVHNIFGTPMLVGRSYIYHFIPEMYPMECKACHSQFGSYGHGVRVPFFDGLAISISEMMYCYHQREIIPYCLCPKKSSFDQNTDRLEAIQPSHWCLHSLSPHPNVLEKALWYLLRSLSVWPQTRLSVN